MARRQRPEKEDRLAALRAALAGGTLRSAHRMVNALHPAEIALLIESLPRGQRDIVWGFVDPELEGEVLLELSEQVRAGLIQGMDAEQLVAVAEGMEVDDLADLVAQLPETVTQRVLASLDRQDRERLNTVLGFREDSAGGLMNTDTVSVRAGRVDRSRAALPADARRAAGAHRQPVRRRPSRPLSRRDTAHPPADGRPGTHRQRLRADRGAAHRSADAGARSGTALPGSRPRVGRGGRRRRPAARPHHHRRRRRRDPRGSRALGALHGGPARRG